MYNLEKPINEAVFPGLQGGPHNHSMAGVGVGLKQVSGKLLKALWKPQLAVTWSKATIKVLGQRSWALFCSSFVYFEQRITTWNQLNLHRWHFFVLDRNSSQSEFLSWKVPAQNFTSTLIFFFYHLFFSPPWEKLMFSHSQNAFFRDTNNSKFKHFSTKISQEGLQPPSPSQNLEMSLNLQGGRYKLLLLKYLAVFQLISGTPWFKKSSHENKKALSPFYRKE